MTYPDTFRQKIGFDKIQDLLQQQCLMDSTRRLCEKTGPVTPFGKLKTYLQQTAEFKTLLMLEAAFPSQDYFDMSGELRHLQVEGTYITLEGLQMLRASYVTLCEIKHYFNRLDREAYPELCAFAARMETDEAVLSELDKLLTPLGEMRDDASQKLFDIREAVRKKESESRRHIARYLTAAKKDGYVDEDAEFTVRNNRMVIPVAAAHKRRMRGFIHDVSSTGQTVFMEPEEIFNLNNEIAELRSEEHIEIIEILKRFSDFLRPRLEVLLSGYRFLTAIDFLRAKAMLAVRLNAGLPVLENRPCIEWKQARHPLLGLIKTPVPLDLKLENGERIVIISGPNAGGKSVCLKTVGLLQYMLQCGLLVSMREDSTMGVFENIFVDIGDEQSIENDLSTYSSHLRNMKFWAEHAGPRTLFLSDELGGGTEPVTGGAIAEALVEHLHRKGAWGIVTTHYTNLKLMAQKHMGIVNGAMLFDQENMQPLYVFRKGLPGSSFAFEIAGKIGLPQSVLASAGRKVGRRQLHFEEELQKLETEKHRLNKQKQEVAVADELLSSTLQKYNRLVEDLEANRNKLVREARAEARELVKKANADIERTIREIREAEAEKEATRRLRQQLQDTVQENDSGERTSRSVNRKTELPLRLINMNGSETRSPSGERTSRSVQNKPLNGSETRSPITPGTLVRLDDGKGVAEVLEIKSGKAKVALDFMSMTLPLDRLTPLTAAEEKRYRDSQTRSTVKIEGHLEGQLNFSPKVDLRGVRAAEAVETVEKLIDEAVLYGEKHLEILHGKGNGILRQMIRAALSKNAMVAHFYDQKEEFGGVGITIVELR